MIMMMMIRMIRLCINDIVIAANNNVCMNYNLNIYRPIISINYIIQDQSWFTKVYFQVQISKNTFIFKALRCGHSQLDYHEIWSG